MNAVERVWRGQHRDFNRALSEAGAVVTEDDGFQWIDREKVGESFIQRYLTHVSVGYARGWL